MEIQVIIHLQMSAPFSSLGGELLLLNSASSKQAWERPICPVSCECSKPGVPLVPTDSSMRLHRSTL